MRKLPQRDPISAHQREVTAVRCVGVGVKCTRCGETRAKALIRGSDPLICANCFCEEHGKKLFELHHPGGAANSPVTTPIWVNDHVAILSSLQYDWPKKTLENPDCDPLLAAAGRTRGFIDTNVYLAEKLLRDNAELLEEVFDYLPAVLGPQWWIGTPIEKFAPEQRKKKLVGHSKSSA
jgi:hypothetical protein